MGDLYIFMIVFPIVLMLSLSFIFSSQVFAIGAYQFVANCPLPLWDIRVSHLSITANNGVAYNQQYLINTGSNDTETVFECTYDLTSNPPTIGVSKAEKYFSGGALAYPYGWLVFAGDSLSQWFTKSWAGISSALAFLNAPAQISGGIWFWGYINVFLFGTVILGVVLMIRGIGN